MTNSNDDGDDPGLVGKFDQSNPCHGHDAAVSFEDYEGFSYSPSRTRAESNTDGVASRASLPREAPSDRELDDTTDEWLMQNDPNYAPYGKSPTELPSLGGDRSPNDRHRLVDYNGSYAFCRRCQCVVRADSVRTGNKYYPKCGNARKDRQSK